METGEEIKIKFSKKLLEEIEVMQRATGLRGGELVRIAYSLFAVHLDAIRKGHSIVIDKGESGCVPFIIPAELGPMYTDPGEITVFVPTEQALARMRELCQREQMDIQTLFMKSIFVLTLHLEAASRHHQVIIKTGPLRRDLKINVLKHVKLTSPYTAPNGRE